MVFVCVAAWLFFQLIQFKQTSEDCVGSFGVTLPFHFDTLMNIKVDFNAAHLISDATHLIVYFSHSFNLCDQIL